MWIEGRVEEIGLRGGDAKRNWKRGKADGRRFRNERVRRGANIRMADT